MLAAGLSCPDSFQRVHRISLPSLCCGLRPNADLALTVKSGNGTADMLVGLETLRSSMLQVRFFFILSLLFDPSFFLPRTASSRISSFLLVYFVLTHSVLVV